MGIPSEDGMPQLLTIIHLVPTECHYKKKPFQQENIMKIYIAAFILLRLMLEWEHSMFFIDPWAVSKPFSW